MVNAMDEETEVYGVNLYQRLVGNQIARGLTDDMRKKLKQLISRLRTP